MFNTMGYNKNKKIMKKLIVVISALFVVSLCNAQSTPAPKDTVQLDSTQVEKILKMPMDTLHHTKPVVPLPPKDTANYKRTMDDADPQKPKSPNPKY